MIYGFASLPVDPEVQLEFHATLTSLTKITSALLMMSIENFNHAK
jgi:hypothetical protein